MNRFLLSIAILLTTTSLLSQEKALSYQFEVGSLVSVGPNRYQKDSVDINGVTSIFYANRLRYEHPSIRLRLASLYQVARSVAVGLELGGNIRLGESFYNNEILFSIPLQVKLLYNFLHLSENYSMGIDGTLGYHFRNYYKIPVTEAGGLIYSSSIVLQNKSRRNINWYTKLGFEHQTENVRRTIFARSPGEKDEDYGFKLNRNQLFLSVGLALN